MKKYSTLFQLSKPKNLIEDSGPPKILLSLNLSANQIENLCNELITTSNSHLDEVLKVSPAEANFQNVIDPLSKLEAWRNTYSMCCIFPSYVSSEKEVRLESQRATKKLEAYEIDLAMRKDVFELVNFVYAKNLKLETEDKRYLDRLIKTYKRNGLFLEADKQHLLKSKMQKLASLSTEFQKNVNEDNTCVYFSEQELKGLTTQFLNSLNKNEINGVQKLRVTMKYPDVYPILEYADLPQTRRKLEFAFQTRCKGNLNILENIISLRAEIAKILGYKCHADYVLEEKMAKNLDTVNNFLNDLKERLTPIGIHEYKLLTNLKFKTQNTKEPLKSYDIGVLHFYSITKECIWNTN